jgi:threonine dehydratase
VQEQAVAEGLTFVAPYDDPLVIAGQGTIGMEILRQVGCVLGMADVQTDERISRMRRHRRQP